MPSLQDSKLAFIGGGNMASAIIGGLVHRGVNKQSICVSEPWDVNRNKIAATGVRTTTANVEAGGDADLVIIAVKPQVTKGVCEELGAAWSTRASLPVVVSIAAGITLDSLREWVKTSDGRTAHVARVMPNTPSLVGEGASGVFASEDVTSDEKELVNAVMGSVSKATEWVDKEELLDVVTGLSGEFLHRQTISILFTIDADRIRSRLFLRYGRASDRQCNVSRSVTGTGHTLGYADLSWCWEDDGRLAREPFPAAHERYQPQWNYVCRPADI